MGQTVDLTMCEDFYQEMTDRHITPFDTMSWEALRNLWRTIRSAEHYGAHDGRAPQDNADLIGPPGEYDDRRVHRKMRDSVWRALKCKAEAYMSERGDESKYEELQELEGI